MKEIFLFISKCKSCKSCEVACIAEHSKSCDYFMEIPLHSFFPKRADEEYTNTITNFVPHPVRCHHCENSECMKACSSGALQKDRATGQVFIDNDRCVGCWMCIMSCPYSAIIPLYSKQKAIKCDQCILVEVPTCVKACPNGALLFCNEEDYAREKRRSEKWCE